MKKAVMVVLMSVLAMMFGVSCTSMKFCKGAGAKKVQRYGSVIGLKTEKLDEYKKLHAACWPEIQKKITECNIRNYSIYLRKLDNGKYYLFGYFEYIGTDFAGDMKKMAADPMTKRWWSVTDPCQEPLPDRGEGNWWASMEEVFHED